MNNLEGINEENFYEITNMFKVQMENLKSKIILLMSQIAVGVILVVPIMQIKDMPRANILKAILNISFSIYIILSIFAVGTMIALLMKKNVDILVNISGVFLMICICGFFSLVLITNIIHENGSNILLVVAIVTAIVPLVNGVVYYKKTKKKIIEGEYRRGNYKYKFNKKLLLFLLPIIPMVVSIGNRGRVIEMVFGKTYFLLALNYLALIIAIAFSYFTVNRIFFIHQLKLNKGEK